MHLARQQRLSPEQADFLPWYRGAKFRADGQRSWSPGTRASTTVSPTLVVHAFHRQGRLKVQDDCGVTAIKSLFKAGRRKEEGEGRRCPRRLCPPSMELSWKPLEVLEDDIPSSFADWNLVTRLCLPSGEPGKCSLHLRMNCHSSSPSCCS